MINWDHRQLKPTLDKLCFQFLIRYCRLNMQRNYIQPLIQLYQQRQDNLANLFFLLSLCLVLLPLLLLFFEFLSF